MIRSRIVRQPHLGRVVLGLGVGASILLAAACGPGNPSEETVAVATAVPAASVERGDYLVRVLACDDCHTPFKMGPEGPEPDMSRRLSGHPETTLLGPPPAPQGGWIWSGSAENTAFAGPWGISYAINLTPDQNTGMGIWTEEMFVGAMRTGRHFGTSRQILPPMPWPAYGQLTDGDLKSVYAYLRTLPAISNRVPDAQPAGE